MRALYRFLPLFGFFLLLTPSLALAISCSGPCDYVWNGIFGFKTAWLNEPRELIINVFLPCAAIYVFTLGLLRATGINYAMGNMEHAIAVIVMLSAMFTGAVGAYNTWALVVMGQFAFWGYVAIFIISGVFFFAGKAIKAKLGFTTEKSLDSMYLKDMKKLDDQIERAEKDLIEYRKQAIFFAEMVPSADKKGVKQRDVKQAKSWRKKATEQEVFLQNLIDGKKKYADQYKVTKAI